MISDVLLWLFVINLGIGLGAGLYESCIVVPMWAKAPPQSLSEPEVGLRFWVWVTTGPLTALTVANLVVALQADGPRRAWWLAASLILLAERAATFSYFVPTMIRLQGGAIPAVAAAAVLARWSKFNVVRHALTFAGLLCAMMALSLN